MTVDQLVERLWPFVHRDDSIPVYVMVDRLDGTQAEFRVVDVIKTKEGDLDYIQLQAVAE